MSKTEQVCCLKRSDLETLMGSPLPQGGFAEPPLTRVLALPQSFLPRSMAEHDPCYKQLIPYQLLCYQGRYFIYQRGGGVGEGRLAGRLSIGIGGHINHHDGNGESLNEDGYRRALLRERTEELVCPPGLPANFIGWINDDSDPVGQVHLGAVHSCQVAFEPDVAIRAHGEDIHSHGWWPPTAIRAESGRFEKWSILALELADR